MIIGIAAGVICFIASTWVKNALGYDDSLDVFGVHGIGGMVGSILTGVFAVGALSASTTLPEGYPGLLEGNPAQVWLQVIGVLATTIYTGVASFIVLKIIDVVIGLRVTDEQEREGLDQALHGEAVH